MSDESGAAIQLRLNDKELKRRAKAFGADLDNARTTTLMRRIAAHGIQSTSRRFDRGEGPGGTSWPVSLRVLMEGGQTLVKMPRLKDSFGMEVTATSAEWGTNLKYAAIHQFGGVIRAKNAPALRFRIGGNWVSKQSVTIPARPFLGIDAEDEAEIVTIAVKWLQRLVPK
ncbi:MAG: phage virion morphogenesis protein [Desulfovibrio sp.]|nr:phage virion morphogenesis protein [Desulfovibrio sp.]